MLFIYWHGKPSDAIIPVAFPAPVMAGLWTLGVVALGIGLAFVQSNIFVLGNGWWPQFAATAMSTISAHHYLADTVLWGRKAGA